jgi:hypothetical protein
MEKTLLILPLRQAPQPSDLVSLTAENMDISLPNAENQKPKQGMFLQ